ncbi:unnamed protein product [Anisakis simplex]|uniref:Ovule protein n=1 Tax=Anisakis simplex TaxID=6269 RepID=A0A0M3JPS2_ANISI|nr:unnamed protein product [Anisakis simplex]
MSPGTGGKKNEDFIYYKLAHCFSMQSTKKDTSEGEYAPSNYKDRRFLSIINRNLFEDLLDGAKARPT